MKKLNNHAFSIMELIICFSIISIITLGMFKVITSLNSGNNNLSIIRQHEDFKNNLLIKIQNDLILKGYQESKDCSLNNIICRNIIFANKETTTIKIDLNNYIIYYDNIKYLIDKTSLILDKDNTKITEENNIFLINIPLSYKNKKIKDDLNINIVHPLLTSNKTGTYEIKQTSINGGLLIQPNANASDLVVFTTHAKTGYVYKNAILKYNNEEHLLETKEFIMPDTSVEIIPNFIKE